MASLLNSCCTSKKIETEPSTLDILNIIHEREKSDCIENTPTIFKCDLFSIFDSCMKKDEHIHRVRFNMDFLEKE